MRETKYMARFGISVPESAQMVLLQVRVSARGCVHAGARMRLFVKSHMQFERRIRAESAPILVKYTIVLANTSGSLAWRGMPVPPFRPIHVLI